MILDNASFHKGGRIEELIKSAGCDLIYLPPPQT
ncbi:transposase [Kamptonema formosum]